MLDLKIMGGSSRLAKVAGFGVLFLITVCILFQFDSTSLDLRMPRFNSSYLQSQMNFLKSQSDDASEVMDPKLFVDEIPNLSWEDLVEDVQRKMPNLPIAFWNRNKNRSMKFSNKCAKFPSIFDLEFSNTYWQTLRTSNGIFHLFGAYLDNRTRNKLGPTVRILGVIDKVQPAVDTYCQFWFEKQREPVLEKSYEYDYIWHSYWGANKPGMYHPHLVACVLPEGYKDQIPQTVSLVANKCDTASNNLRVVYDRPEEKRDFAVCVKGMDFLHVDLSVRLVEWIELLKLLGADKIFIYELHVHPNMSKVLKHYQNEGSVEVTPINLPGGQPNAPTLQQLYLSKKLIPKRKNELVPYNDCFYKHMYQYKYIALLDIDEVIIPLQGDTWKELMDVVVPKATRNNRRKRDSFNFRNVYFLDDLLQNDTSFGDIPKYMYMLQHVYRTMNHTRPGWNIKSFHNTETVLSLHNHFPMSCLGGSCKNYAVETREAQMQHYRGDCMKTLKSCDSFRRTEVRDTAIWKFKEPLVAAASAALRTMGFIRDVDG